MATCWRIIAIVLILTCYASAGDTTFTITDDTYINQSATTTNYGAADSIRCTDVLFGGAARKALLKGPDSTWLAGLAGTITYCTLYVYVRSRSALESPAVTFYGVAKDPTETQATWNRWNNASAYEWGTAGAASTCNPITYNTSDGSGCDRGSLAYSSVMSSWPTSGWYAIALNTSWVNGILAGTVTYLWIIATPSEDGQYVTWHSAENGTNKPYIKIGYSSDLSYIVGPQGYHTVKDPVPGTP